MLNAKEAFLKTLEGEIPVFERVLKAVPAENQDYRPDPKSKTAPELASGMTSEVLIYPKFLKEGVVNMDSDFKPSTGSPTELADIMTKGWQEVKSIVAGMSDAEWEMEADMQMGGASAWKATRGEMAWGMLLDLIHHRGQLSTYLRAMGGKVPSIYGPSADSQG